MRKESEKPYAPGYIDNYLTAIRSRASWNWKVFQRNIKIKDVSKTPTLDNERVPTQDELRKVLYKDKTSMRKSYPQRVVYERNINLRG